ncbi:glucosaminidase domain-containing protein [Anaerococcus vaginalis]|uniref:Mannosyl-glycoprotein endo-beta-N-acetylglucosaminidase n=2 Tax=Anaerococcus vaginalis TaxID=33037 RepID=C7HU35_9FIRM|nr:glucosaminidase domain-containing protein [Anaerococcus vaginalis]EEU12815.1 mannosyl-glycoprotein endo-beta-N-acetylglucosaminidase [Anaerococcus vaginalis ATCC 51170]QQB61160.1 glucosaminidase domain-containing protein [Anaerococcus vaginalis]
MKQNSNKNITKITSGALVLLLASGGLFSNSSAKDLESTNVEKVIVDKKLDLEEKDKIKENESIQESEKNEEVENTDKNIEEVLNNQNEDKSEENSTIQTLVDNIEDDQTNTVESEKETLEENLNEVKNPEVSENNIENSKNENEKVENVEDVKEETEETDEDKLIVDEKDNIQEENIDNVKENLPENPINDKKDEEPIREKAEENKAVDNKIETSEKELIKEEKSVIEQKEEKNSNEALQVAPVIKKVAVKSPALKAAPKAVSYQNKSSNNGKYINNYNNRKEFLAMLASHSSLAKEYNIFPEVMMGQAILESGWGESTLAKYSKNLFGVKVPNSEKGKGKGHVYLTNEEINGKNIKIKDEFRKFDTYEQSIRQYLSLLSGRYYSSFGVTKAKDYKEQLRLIKKAGYATASNYVDAVLNVITRNNLSALANQYLNSNTTRANNSAAKPNNAKKNSNTLASNTSNKNISTIKTDKKANANSKQSQRVAKATQKPSVKVADTKSTTNPQNILASSTKSKKLSSDSKNIIVASTANAVKKPVENIQANNNVENNETKKSSPINNRKKSQTTDNNVSATTNTTYSNSSSKNVKTGIGSLSSILTTLSAASFALIASKKRK